MSLLCLVTLAAPQFGALPTNYRNPTWSWDSTHSKPWWEWNV